MIIGEEPEVDIFTVHLAKWAKSLTNRPTFEMMMIIISQQ